MNNYQPNEKKQKIYLQSFILKRGKYSINQSNHRFYLTTTCCSQNHILSLFYVSLYVANYKACCILLQTYYSQWYLSIFCQTDILRCAENTWANINVLRLFGVAKLQHSEPRSAPSMQFPVPIKLLFYLSNSNMLANPSYSSGCCRRLNVKLTPSGLR